MTREIKFRIPMFTDKGTFTEFQYLKLGDDIEGTLCGYNGEPQQYTGQNDKNGVEIFEGDILNIKLSNYDNIQKISVEPLKNGGFGINEIESINFWNHLRIQDLGSLVYGNSEDGWDFEWAEVIGNIYESKHLLDK